MSFLEDLGSSMIKSDMKSDLNEGQQGKGSSEPSGGRSSYIDSLDTSFISSDLKESETKPERGSLGGLDSSFISSDLRTSNSDSFITPKKNPDVDLSKSAYLISMESPSYASSRSGSFRSLQSKDEEREPVSYRRSPLAVALETPLSPFGSSEPFSSSSSPSSSSPYSKPSSSSSSSVSTSSSSSSAANRVLRPSPPVAPPRPPRPAAGDGDGGFIGPRRPRDEDGFGGLESMFGRESFGASRFWVERPEIDREKAWKDEEALTLEERRARYRSSKYLTLADIQRWPEYARVNNTERPSRDEGYKPNPTINNKIALWRGDITQLELDAIVNAANESLMGGGGVDGAIHSAAGDQLWEECRTLHGCKTGQTKITRGYRLPAKYVLHTVGPIDEESEDALTSCYLTCLDLVVKHNIRTVAFCGISTGIYGFPLQKACKVALETTRKWLEINHDKVDLIVFVTYLAKERDTYENQMAVYFPIKEYDPNVEVKLKQVPEDRPSYASFFRNYRDEPSHSSSSSSREGERPSSSYSSSSLPPPPPPLHIPPSSSLVSEGKSYASVVKEQELTVVGTSIPINKPTATATATATAATATTVKEKSEAEADFLSAFSSPAPKATVASAPPSSHSEKAERQTNTTMRAVSVPSRSSDSEERENTQKANVGSTPPTSGSDNSLIAVAAAVGVCAIAVGVFLFIRSK